MSFVVDQAEKALTAEERHAAGATATNSEPPPRSWIFRTIDAISWLISRLFGFISIVVCTSVVANVPILQLMSLGYLLEVSGRICRGGRFRNAFVGLDKASRIGGLLLGTWVVLLPVRFFSHAFWFESYLIDATSTQTRLLRIVQLTLTVAAVVHVSTAWASGGRLRYFFWPLLAPVSFGLWAVRMALGSRRLKPVLSLMLNWLSPHVVDDIVRARPPSDWFVPAIIWRQFREGTLFTNIRDGLWNFLAGLRPWYYFRLGLSGAVGTMLWLIPPTLLMVAATTIEGPMSTLAGILGLLLAIPIFAMLPLIQAHFSRSRRLASFLSIRQVLSLWTRAPVAYLAALLITLLFSLPLFLLKIEPIPSELLWILSVVFMLFAIPSRMAIAMAYRRATRRPAPYPRWFSWPIMLLAMPVSALFAIILSLTRYVSWHGAFSLIENHVFLLPAPFWLLDKMGL